MMRRCHTLFGNRDMLPGVKIKSILKSFVSIEVTINYVTIMGMIWVICPVISKVITDTEIEWVTDPANAAAATVAYPPKKQKNEIKEKL